MQTVEARTGLSIDCAKGRLMCKMELRKHVKGLNLQPFLRLPKAVLYYKVME